MRKLIDNCQKFFQKKKLSRQEIIQKLIDKIDAQSYVEIGLGDGDIFNTIECAQKYGVDPQFCDYVYEKGTECVTEPTHKMTSDEFFEQNKETFDIIFIDGMHEADYVERDINNSLDCLNDSGYVICHDMNPKSEKAQIVPRIQEKWNGDCWKAWVKIKSTNPNLNMYVINTDNGCGVIQKGSQELLDLKGLDLTYNNLKTNRKKWLNLISVGQFTDHELR